MKEFKQPDSLEGIAKALEEAIDNVAVSDRKEAAATMAYDIIYCNNSFSEDDKSKFLDEYPELVDVAEFALEFDFETDAAYLDNRWKLIVDRVHTFAQRVQTKLDIKSK